MGQERRLIGVADPAGLIGDLLVEEFVADSLDAVRAADMEEFSVDEARSRLSASSYDLLLMIPRSAGRRSAEMRERHRTRTKGRTTGRRCSRGPAFRPSSRVRSGGHFRGHRFGRACARSACRASTRARCSGAPPIDVVNVTESGEARSQDIYRMLSFAIAFFFYFILLIYGQMIVRAISRRSSRTSSRSWSPPLARGN